MGLACARAAASLGRLDRRPLSVSTYYRSFHSPFFFAKKLGLARRPVRKDVFEKSLKGRSRLDAQLIIFQLFNGPQTDGFQPWHNVTPSPPSVAGMI